MSSTFTVNEHASCRYTATLEDALGVAIPLATIVTAVLTLTDVSTGAVINSRSDQDIKNANNVTIHATSGLLTWSLQPADNAIATAGAEYELHRAVFEIVYATDQKATHQFFILVQNLAGVP